MINVNFNFVAPEGATIDFKGDFAKSKNALSGRMTECKRGEKSGKRRIAEDKITIFINARSKAVGKVDFKNFSIKAKAELGKYYKTIREERKCLAE